MISKIQKGGTYILKPRDKDITEADDVVRAEILDLTETSVYVHYVDPDNRVRVSRAFFDRQFEVIEDLPESESPTAASDKAYSSWLLQQAPF